MEDGWFGTQFFFHGNLNDFLPLKKRHHWMEQRCKAPTTIKDTFEAIGVPHTEVQKTTVNGQETTLACLLQPNDHVEVFPYEMALPEAAPKSFVLDVHLGALARLLRMLGVDTVYRNDYDDKEIVNIAVQENRSVLTRDVGLLKHKILQWGYWLRSQQPEKQLMDVINRFSLCSCVQPFSRCISCNGQLQTAKKEDVLELLPPQTKECFDEFYQCSHCKKVYWNGSHYEHMQQLVERVKSVAC